MATQQAAKIRVISPTVITSFTQVSGQVGLITNNQRIISNDKYAEMIFKSSSGWKMRYENREVLDADPWETKTAMSGKIIVESWVITLKPLFRDMFLDFIKERESK